ncbi:SDR family oxidoreductase [Paraferrimonas sedimenticola]|uniref:NAD(P)-dependent oxidoreductase n=1 Tax=Paraferrimonas sedimenticola TaxID=375674 RepID=A0AA37RXB1_9GAMM|nr:SDR family oxidoreductase [Paraferrimonas sedimenticola]GLP96683.1 NAD(P)-dependent oxidoreductase [Paraferrimonas sedimenticola]
MSTAKSISIISCGWFGRALGAHLSQKGWQVKGAKRELEAAQELAEQGIEGYQLSLEPKLICSNIDELLDSDYCVVNLPPRLRAGDSDYLEKLDNLLAAMANKSYQRVVYISSTGVYSDSLEVATEADASAHSESARVMLEAEQCFQQAHNAVVIRFAGLIGAGRQPGRFLAGRKDMAKPLAPVNLVHLRDCVAACEHILTLEQVQPAYNLAAPDHPTRRAFYQAAAESMGLEAPQFIDDQQAGKRVESSAIVQSGYRFQVTDLMACLSDPNSWK